METEKANQEKNGADKTVVDQMTDLVAGAAGALAETAVKAVAKKTERAIAKRIPDPGEEGRQDRCEGRQGAKELRQKDCQESTEEDREEICPEEVRQKSRAKEICEEEQKGKKELSRSRLTSCLSPRPSAMWLPLAHGKSVRVDETMCFGFASSLTTPLAYRPRRLHVPASDGRPVALHHFVGNAVPTHRTALVHKGGRTRGCRRLRFSVHVRHGRPR
ncbi:hypothetical protein ACVWXM_006748 [Bradyrhizobium sp. GM7.3]